VHLDVERPKLPIMPHVVLVYVPRQFACAFGNDRFQGFEPYPSIRAALLWAVLMAFLSLLPAVGAAGSHSYDVTLLNPGRGQIGAFLVGNNKNPLRQRSSMTPKLLQGETS
jgi:hypothetical protein